MTVVANELPIARFLNWEDEFENSNVTKPERTVTVKQNMEIVANYEIQDFIAAYNSDKAEIWRTRERIRLLPIMCGTRNVMRLLL